MASTAAWMANPYWTASAEAGKWAANKVGGPIKSGVNKVWNIPGSIWGGIKGSIGGQNSFQANAPQLDQTQANADLADAQNARASQGYLLNRLDQQMQGNGPTVAGIQAQQGIAQALRNASTQASSARGVSRALALRSAAIGGQQAQQQANRDAALMRAQEQLSAQQQYGGLATQQRTGDVQTRQLSLDAAKADQNAAMQAMGYNTQVSEGNATRAQKGTGAVLSGIGGAVKGIFSDIRAKEDISQVEETPTVTPSFAQALRASLAQPAPVAQQQDPTQLPRLMDSADAGYASTQAGLQRAAADTNASNAGIGETSNGMPGGVVGGAGGFLEGMGNGLLSDERSKERIRELELELAVERGQRPVRELDRITPGTMGAGVLTESERRKQMNAAVMDGAFDGVRPYQYRYRPEFAGYLAAKTAPGDPVGQAVTYADARAPRTGVMAQDLEQTPARVAVENTPVGKVINERRALGVTLANQAALNKKVDDLERRVSRRM